MRIAYLLSSLSNSGPINVAFDLVNLMVKHGHQVVVYYFDDKKNLNFPCKTIKISMKSHIDFSKFDVIHTHGVRPQLFVLFHKPLFCKTPTCTTIHGYRHADKGIKALMISNMGLFASVRDNKVILLSEHMMSFYSSYLPKRKLTFAYNSRIIDEREDLTEKEKIQILSFKENDTLLCSVSGLNKRKGIWQIISALPYFDHLRFCVVGDGDEMEALKQLAHDKNVSDRVLFVGRKPAGYRYLKYADVFVMPSYSEGFPLAMLEAASIGKAILCSDIPVFEEIFTDKEVVRFELDDIASLRKALSIVLANKEELSRNVHHRFITSYSPECFYKKHLEIYTDLINKSKNK